MNVYQKINAVMKEVQYIQKDAKIQGYKAVTHDQLVSVARGSIVNHGLALVVSQKSSEFDEREEGSKMRMYRGWYTVSLVNIEDASDKVSVDIEAHALDNGDKAPGKCATYATKTAIIKLLWLESGENDESRAEARNTIDATQETELAELIGGDSKTWHAITKAYAISHLNQIKLSKFDEVKARIVKFKAANNANN